MSKITKVRTKVKQDGSVLAIFSLEGQDNPVFLTGKQVQAACGLRNNFSVLKDSDLSVEYYSKGDTLISGAECTKDGTIVKSFEIELSPRLAGIASAAAFGASMFG